MKIVKCQKCGKYCYDANNCFYCGNERNFVVQKEITVDEIVAENYIKAKDDVENRRYRQALERITNVLNQNPQTASAYWLRYLAQNKCSNTLELVKKGFNLMEDSDYRQAMHLAEGEEKEIYLQIEKAMEKLKGSFLNEINRVECEELKAMPIKEISNQTKNNYEDKINQIKDKWLELRLSEQDLYMLTKKIHLELQADYMVIESAKDSVEKLKNEISGRGNVSRAEEDAYSKVFTNRIENAKIAQNHIKQLLETSAVVNEYHEKEMERDHLLLELKEMIQKLDNYNKTIKTKVNQGLYIEKNSKLAKKAAHNYDFEYIRKYIGDTKFNEIFSLIMSSDQKNITENIDRATKQNDDSGNINEKYTGKVESERGVYADKTFEGSVNVFDEVESYKSETGNDIEVGYEEKWGI